jgi:hypothetical protein
MKMDCASSTNSISLSPTAFEQAPRRAPGRWKTERLWPTAKNEKEKVWRYGPLARNQGTFFSLRFRRRRTSARSPNLWTSYY